MSPATPAGTTACSPAPVLKTALRDSWRRMPVSREVLINTKISRPIGHCTAAVFSSHVPSDSAVAWALAMQSPTEIPPR